MNRRNFVLGGLAAATAAYATATYVIVGKDSGWRPDPDEIKSSRQAVSTIFTTSNYNNSGNVYEFRAKDMEKLVADYGPQSCESDVKIGDHGNHNFIILAGQVEKSGKPELAVSIWEKIDGEFVGRGTAKTFNSPLTQKDIYDGLGTPKDVPQLSGALQRSAATKPAATPT